MSKIENMTRYVVIFLCNNIDGLWLEGKINIHELSRRTEVSTSVLSRLFSDSYYQLQKKNLNLLAEYFKVSIDQIKGNQLIEDLYESASLDVDVELLLAKKVIEGLIRKMAVIKSINKLIFDNEQALLFEEEKSGEIMRAKSALMIKRIFETTPIR